jgi:hypothetical protein
MFGRRRIQVDLVKEKKIKKEVDEKMGPSFEEKAIVIGRLVERSIKKLTIAVVVVVLADTVRRVAVEATSQVDGE